MDIHNSAVTKQTITEHGQLINLIDELLSALRRLPDDIQWPSSQWLTDSEILDFIRVQALSLEHAKQGAIAGYYKDAYNNIRMVFEAYFLLILISTCIVYTRKLKVKKGAQESSLEEARERAKRQIRGNLGDDLVEIFDEGGDTLKVVLKGQKVVDQDGNYTGIMIPFYYGAWKEYKPREHHLEKPWLEKRLSIKRFLQSDWKATARHNSPSFYAKHTYLYQVIISFQKRLENLQINNVLNRKQIARVLVHYNYLSSYSHSTQESINAIRDIQAYHLIGGGGIDISYNHYHGELTLLYICHLLSMYLRHALYYLTTWRSIPVNNERRLYRSLCRRVQEQYGYFWFIFNEPHEYDKFDHANRQSDHRKNLIYCPDDIRDGDVRYYEDPLLRLKQLHWSHTEFSTGNTYISPFPRDDGWR